MSEINKKIVKKVLGEERERYDRLKIDEKYWQRLVISNPKRDNQITLGRIQSRLKAIENYIKFLEELCN